MTESPNWLVKRESIVEVNTGTDRHLNDILLERGTFGGALPTGFTRDAGKIGKTTLQNLLGNTVST